MRCARYASREGVRLTASAGIAIREPEESFDHWFARADEALYRAKQASRDRMELQIK